MAQLSGTSYSFGGFRDLFGGGKTSTVSNTGDASIDGLFSGIKWDSTALTFNFPTRGGYYPSTYSDRNEPTLGFETATAEMQAAVRTILANFSDVSALTFQELSSNDVTAVLSIGMTPLEGNLAGWGYGPERATRGGDLWIDTGYRDNGSDFDLGTFDYNLLTHEIGHTLGLKHPHDSTEFDNATTTPKDRDGHEYSVMSYFSYPGATSGTLNVGASYQQSLMMDDIAALQHMYGANFNTRAGNTTYSFDPATGRMSIDGIVQNDPAVNKVFLTIWDGGGSDTYDFSNYTVGLKVHLEPGRWSVLDPSQLADFGSGHTAQGSVYNARQFNGDARSLIENAKGGSGNDELIGNAGNNVLHGGSGSDSLFGRSGEDQLFGGAGADFLAGEDHADVLFGEAGNDRLFGGAGKDWLLGGADNDILSGGADGDTLNGDAGNDQLAGEAGNDHLHGGTGNDELSGGLGNDTLYGAVGNDVFRFRAGDGRDTIYDFVSGGTEDWIRLSSTTIDTFSEIMSATQDYSGYCVITLDASTSLTLMGVSKGHLTLADFGLDNPFQVPTDGVLIA